MRHPFCFVAPVAPRGICDLKRVTHLVALLCLTSAMPTVAGPDSAENSRGLGPIRSYISTGWDTLTRSMNETLATTAARVLEYAEPRARKRDEFPITNTNQSKLIRQQSPPAAYQGCAKGTFTRARRGGHNCRIPTFFNHCRMNNQTVVNMI